MVIRQKIFKKEIKMSSDKELFKKLYKVAQNQQKIIHKLAQEMGVQQTNVTQLDLSVAQRAVDSVLRTENTVGTVQVLSAVGTADQSEKYDVSLRVKGDAATISSLTENISKYAPYMTLKDVGGVAIKVKNISISAS
jgi:hypothetical protein